MALDHELTLITGVTGFLGGRILERLVAEGTPVSALTRRELPAHLAALDVDLRYGDLLDPASLTAAVKGAHTVIHCAALVTDFAPYKDFMRVNGDGTANIVNAARAAGVRRFVHLSTTDVYGYPAAPCDEDAPLRPVGLGYNVSKIQAEVAVREGGLPHVIIRPATIYGPRGPFEGEIIPMLQRREMVLLGRGGQDAGLVYVDNVVDLVLAACNSDRPLGEAYNACDGEGISWKGFCDALADLVGAPRCEKYAPRWLVYALAVVMERFSLLLHRKRRPLLTRMGVKLLGTPQYHFNHKARRDLGWEPRVSFTEGIRRLGAWLAR